MTFTLGVVLFAVGIGLSIALHEFGHLLTAKAFGMKATQYFVGFGPTLFSFRRGETEYGLKAIPAGGYVKIIGMTPLEEDDATLDFGPRRRPDPRSPFPPRGAPPLAGAPLGDLGAPEGDLGGAAAARLSTTTQPGDPTAPPVQPGPVQPGPVQPAAVQPAAVQPAAGGRGALAADGVEADGPDTVRVGGRRVQAAGGARAFWRFPAWQRTIVLSAGSLTHLLIAVLALYGAALTAGLPLGRAVVGQVQPCVVSAINPAGDVPDCKPGDRVAPAQQAGLRPGDRIIRVGNTPIDSFEDLQIALRGDAGQTLPVTFLRDGQQQTVTMTVAEVARKPVGTEQAGSDKLARVGAIGISPAATEKFGAVGAVGATVRFTGTVLRGTFGALAKFPEKVPSLVTALSGQQRDPNGPVSVVGVSRVGGQALEAGSALVFVLLFAGFNIFVGVFNLFPLLPLDGGHIAILLFEKARSRIARAFGRADPGRVDYAKLMPLTMLVIVLFGGISLLAILADIVNPIANPFQ